MQITRIELTNFRNHQHFLLGDIGTLLIIVGNNAVGKTNIIEALQLISMHESFRRPKNDEIRFKQQKEGEDALIMIDLSVHNTINTKQITFKENTRVYFYNKKERPARELIGLIPAVLFTPDDLLVIKGPPEQRRDMLDSLGGRLSGTFASIRAEYYKALRQKNSLLRQEVVDRDLLDSWNINLAKLGVSLRKHRQGLFEQLLQATASAYTTISGGEELAGSYIAFWGEKEDEKNDEKNDEKSDEKNSEKNDPVGSGLFQQGDAWQRKTFSEYGGRPPDALLETLIQKREEEIAAKRALIGPHKDDICFSVNGHDARRFASQGQQRTLSLALKIAETEILRRVSGKVPLLLLDDVMSELDTARRSFFVDLISKSTQTVLTTTNLGYFNEEFLRTATIVELPDTPDKRTENQRT